MDRAPESLTSNALPQRYVAKIFQELQGNYGTRFLNQWKTGQVLEDGTDAGVINAMAIWGKNLGGFIDRPECIRQVLDRLPSEPPSLPQFVELCREAARRVGSTQAALPHKADPEKAKAATNRLMAQLSGRADDYDPLLWAKRPKSQKAMDAVIDGAKRNDSLRQILADLKAANICSEAGKLVKRYKGQGQWA